MIVWFGQPADQRAVGGKGWNLCRMVQAGLPVPAGFCVTPDNVSSISVNEIAAALQRLNAPAVAVRSSAIEEDSPNASFAGIYKSVLNVVTPEDVVHAVAEIQQSASDSSAIGYRKRRGISESSDASRMAVVVQSFIPAEASGVVFMRDPVSGADRIVVEASWGLGEAVVKGIVTPDHWEISKDGEVLSARIAEKDVAVVADANGTREMKIDLSRRDVPSLDQRVLREIVELARRCEELFGGPQDVEWALDKGRIWLLQSRPITPLLS